MQADNVFVIKPVQQPQLVVRNPIESAMAMLDRDSRRAYYRQYKQECMKHPVRMRAMVIPEEDHGRVLGVWRSRTHLAVAWPNQNPAVLARLSVNRVDIDPVTGRWLAGISWDDLYRIKNECGFADFDAVEVFPAEDKLVNVANLRHLWVMAERIAFGLEHD